MAKQKPLSGRPPATLTSSTHSMLCLSLAWPPLTPHLGPATTGRGERIFKVTGQMYYNYAPTLQHVRNAAAETLPGYAQLYNLDKDVASRYRFEALLAMRKKPNDNAYAVGVCLGPLHSSSHTPVELSKAQNHCSPQDNDDQPAPTENLWTRRTHMVLDICGTAMHSTRLARQFKNAGEYSKHAPSCELRIHDVRPSTTWRGSPSALPCDSRLQPLLLTSVTLLLPLNRIANLLTISTVHRATSISRGAARGKGRIQTSAEGQ